MIGHIRNEVSLELVKLNIALVCVVVLSDASFVNDFGKETQLRFSALFGAGQKRATIVRYGSIRCRRISRSVVLAEIQALVSVLGSGYIVGKALEALMDWYAEFEKLVDSYMMFNIFENEKQGDGAQVTNWCLSQRKSYGWGEYEKIDEITRKEYALDNFDKGSNIT